MEKNIRMGFFVSLLFVAVIGVVSFIMQKMVWNKKEGHNPLGEFS
jgi:hypothetical protein